MIIPKKLKKGDHIRVIFPSSSMVRIGGAAGNQEAEKVLGKLGLTVSFSKNSMENDQMGSSSIESRVEDLHEAFLDPQVQGILTSIGGFNSNELLPYLDYELIGANPKIFCGYSDITALNNAIYTKSDLVTYSGPHYSSFKMKMLQEYQTASFEDVLMKFGQHQLTASEQWSDDPWFLDEYKPNISSNGWKVYSEGTAEGVSLGGNIGTFNLLSGTVYQPLIDHPVIFMEMEEEGDFRDFARDMASILQVYRKPAALVIGRFSAATEMTEERLIMLLDKHPVAKTIPVLYNVNFGHTQPIFTFPVGQKMTINTANQEISFMDHEEN
ncbi:LD-carboxypeptidase [Enterococcus sp. BWB1-3]|uniref:S66 family peptidase n=1 Tax=Enterococcus sp. BWB1-3 TaxID=2787713 RepID=UPI0019244BD9|nr:S66 peptidase family protein [Enterococcus sp. BWB1-3]MBL1229502.1 LD-carboxypeptidase [Enterococcus sp. BWB1-3]